MDWARVTGGLVVVDDYDGEFRYDRHLRVMRQRCRRRRDQLGATLAERVPHVRALGIAAGLHAVLHLPPGTERSVPEAAAPERLALAGLAP